MANLTTLFPAANFIVDDPTDRFRSLYVFNTSVDSPQNAGRCCLFTTPSNACWLRFELWGSGGNGPGGCCCQQPSQSGGAGAYARITIPATAGNQYTICAGGSGCCTTSCCGSEGFSSFVTGGSGGSTVNICAAGGPPSCGMCFIGYSGCICVGNTLTCRSNSFSGATFGLPAISGASNPGTCGFQTWQYVPAGPNIGPGVRHSWDYCNSSSGCQALGGFATFPGGGGGGAITNGGPTCWGTFGAGGLVVVTYR